MAGQLLITNQNRTLAEVINAILDQSKDLAFLVGYFYFSGFCDIYNKIGDKNLRVLIGLDIEVNLMNELKECENFLKKFSSKYKRKEEYFNGFIDFFNRTDYFDSQEGQKSFKFFYEKLKNGTLEIRQTLEPNHSKMYLFEARDTLGGTQPGSMIVGSSNLSHNGLNSQNELNVVFHDLSYNDGKELFDKLWTSAAVIADKDNIKDFDEKVIKRIWLDKMPSPYSMYLRVLDEYFKINYEDGKFKSPRNINESYMDFEYQTDAVKESLDRISRHNGVIIADVVGLGKSIIASAIAYNLNLPVVIIAPPHLKEQWEDYCKDFHFRKRAHIRSSGLIEEALQDFASKDEQMLVIIDEAHKYRNPQTFDYIRLHQLCQGNKVILLTATPYNNRPQDLYSLIKLFQIPGKSTIKTTNNLGADFDSIIAEYNKEYKKAQKSPKDAAEFDAFVKKITKKMLSIISPVIIRRSRKDLEANTRYREDLKKQKMSFPTVCDPILLEYDLGDLGILYENTLDAICPKVFDASQKDDDEKLQEGVYRASRYQPLKYLKDESKDKVESQLEEEGIDIDLSQLLTTQKNLAKFMRRLLTRRFESSIAAFQISLKNMIDNSENILRWIDKRGKVPIYKYGSLPDIDGNMGDSEGDDLFVSALDKQIENLQEKGLFELEVKDIKDAFIRDVEADIAILKGIQGKWFGENGAFKRADPKLENFKKKLEEMVSGDSKRKKGEPERKIAVFSEFADTVDYLYKELSKSGFKVFSYTSKSASGSNKEIIRENFDAGISENKQKDDFKILLATDAISEGYNLHRAGAVFNYDIPFNPTRVIQRIGRINRINKKVFEELYIYNYFPTAIGERDVRVKLISTIKMKMIHAIMGGDMKILTSDEKLFLSEFNKKFRQAEDLSDQKSWDADYREEWERAQKTPEYEEALNIKMRSRIGRFAEQGNGVIVFGKRGSECVFKIADSVEKPLQILAPEDALPLFKADKTERPSKVSDGFETIYQHIKKSLFGGAAMAETPNKMRFRALNKIKSWENSLENDAQTNEYTAALLKVCEIDAFPNYAAIIKAKNLKDLKEKISPSYLESIIETAKKIDAQPGNIILAEELK